MNTLEQKIAQQLGLLMLENAKLSALVDDLKAQIAKAQADKGNGIYHKDAEDIHAQS